MDHLAAFSRLKGLEEENARLRQRLNKLEDWTRKLVAQNRQLKAVINNLIENQVIH